MSSTMPCSSSGVCLCSAAAASRRVRVRLGGEWATGSDASFTFSQSMGELTLRVPTNVRLETDFRNSDGEPRQPVPDADNPTDPNAPRLRVRVLSSMGESRVIRY